MSKYHQLNNLGLKKFYIITRPTDASQIEDEEDGVADEDYRWLAKARRLQARRWRKIQEV